MKQTRENAISTFAFIVTVIVALGMMISLIPNAVVEISNEIRLIIFEASMVFGLICLIVGIVTDNLIQR